MPDKNYQLRRHILRVPVTPHSSNAHVKRLALCGKMVYSSTNYMKDVTCNNCKRLEKIRESWRRLNEN